MNIEWKYSESTIKPDTIQLNEGMAYLHKDIQEVERINQDSSTTIMYTYMEAYVTIDIAVKYMNDKFEKQNEIMQANIDYLAIVTEIEI